MLNPNSTQGYLGLISCLLLLLALLLWWSLFSWSAFPISALDALNAVIDKQEGSIAHTIVTELRLPRALVAILVGFALAAAGAVMQGLTQNPLGIALGIGG